MKAATTSVFMYLNAHPQICGSSVKETTFFGDQFTGNWDIDINKYSSYFKKCSSDVDYIMEASTGYLHNGIKVAQRIHSMLPDVKLLFILREPVDRLYSYYNHMISKLVKDFDRTVSFNEYVEKCFEYSNNGINSVQSKLNHMHYAALQYGRYANYINEYLQIFPREQIKIMFYENLETNPKKFMHQLCNFLGINAHLYDNYEFTRANETFDSKIKIIHKAALYINKKLEPYLRNNQSIKNKITNAYKYINKNNACVIPMSESTKLLLQKYYEKSNSELASIVSTNDLPGWVDLQRKYPSHEEHIMNK
ncbi:MAG: sulfotransferase domain-containing protein [Candidatus Kuenenia sp.]|nr:sulfotransferase domain-containing protein [Candidatus Kuenenia hertensis]